MDDMQVRCAAYATAVPCIHGGLALNELIYRRLVLSRRALCRCTMLQWMPCGLMSWACDLC
jgi:hypothetical protein